MDKSQYTSENDESGVKNDSIWTKTPLRDFCFKCIMNKHNLCHNPKCACLCHQRMRIRKTETITVMMYNDLVKKLRIMQAKMIQKENKSICFSHVVNLVLDDVLKK